MFGKLPGDKEAARKSIEAIFRILAKALHPDRFPQADRELAGKLFSRLVTARKAAEAAIEAGIYGKSPSSSSVTISSRTRTYSVGELFATGSMSDVFRCSFVEGGGRKQDCLLKIARSPADSDLMRRETEAIKQILGQTKTPSLRSYFPEVLDSLRVNEPGTSSSRPATVFAFRNGLHGLDKVMQAYPAGIDPRDMAWMWKRLLGALFCAHEAGIIHGAVLPPHVLLDTQAHGVLLADWTCSVRNDRASRIPAIDPSYQGHYPPEILRKEVVTPATDIYLAAMTMIQLLGGDIRARTVPSSVPKQITEMLHRCTQSRPSDRPQNAFEVHMQFDKFLEPMFGPRKFRKFTIPV